MAAKPNDTVVIKTLLSGARSTTPSTGKDAGTALTNNLQEYFNKSIATLRAQGRTLEAVRTLARVSGDTSAAVAATVRLANTLLRFKVYGSDHQLSAGGGALLRSLQTRLNFTSDYSTGYDHRMALDTVKEALLRSVLLTGAAALELVLDKARLPYQLLPANVEAIKFKTASRSLGSGRKIIPYQTASGGDIELDIPTFFYQSLDQDLTSAYSNSPIEPAVNTAPYHTEVIEDIRRVTKRSGHSRLIVSLITERLLKAAPMNVKSDPDQLTAWVEATRAGVQAELEKLSPESALVVFDTMEASYLNSEIGAKSDYRPLIETIDAILSTALKCPASILGKHASGSQNTSSTESLLFIKTAQGLQNPVAVVMARAMTLAVRLYGFDGYVTAEFDDINLRPAEETEAFKTMRQARVLEQLSFGFISDAEAAELLHTGPRDPNAPPLSGTLFQTAAPKDAVAPVSDAHDPVKRAVTTDAPRAGGGRSNAKR